MTTETLPRVHQRLTRWVEEVAELTQPNGIYWCDGSEAEWERITT
jgi:phosphoenolpyruvate carboxykinase (GTP)